MSEMVRRLYLGWAKSPRKSVDERIADSLRSREEREANQPIEDLTLGEIKQGVFVRDYLLSRDWRGKRLICRVDTDLAPVITYSADGFQATVRFTGDIGCQVYCPTDKRLSELMPNEPGDYFYSSDGLHRVGEWRDRGGRIRRALCRLRLHHKVIVTRTVWKIKQCPHCLAVHQGMVYGFGPSEWAGQVEMTQRWVDSYDRKFPLPGNGWVSYSLDGAVSEDRRSISFDL